MKVRIKKLHEDAVVPVYGKPGDAGLDLVATSMTNEKDGHYVQYGTGLAFEIPEGYVGYIFPRSSISNTCHIMANCVGVCDSNYRGEVSLRFRVGGTQDRYEVGHKIGQIVIMPVPHVDFVEAKELSDTVRGAKGYGSSGK